MKSTALQRVMAPVSALLDVPAKHDEHRLSIQSIARRNIMGFAWDRLMLNCIRLSLRSGEERTLPQSPRHLAVLAILRTYQLLAAQVKRDCCGKIPSYNLKGKW